MDGTELRRRRQALTLTQRELGGYLGVSTVSISLWEIGRQRIQHPVMLGLALQSLERQLPGDLERTG